MKLGAAGQDVQGDVQDMVGLVVGATVFEQMQVVIDVSISPALRASKSMAPMPPGPNPGPDRPDRSGVVGGDHGAFTLGTGAVFDAAEDFPLASSQFVQDT